jgi:hypothetical protein
MRRLNVACFARFALSTALRNGQAIFHNPPGANVRLVSLV